MSTKAQSAHDNFIRAAIWGLIVVACVLAYFCIHPIFWSNSDNFFSSDSRLVSGTTITLDAVSDFLIIVDYSHFPSSPDDFLSVDFSLAWLNTIQQEIGPVTLINADRFQDFDLSKYKFVILTQSAASNDAWVPRLKAYLDRGGVLVLEMPGGAIRQMGSADGHGGLRNVQNFTYMAGMEASQMAALAQLDLSAITQLIGSAGPLEDSESFMTIDGVPVVYRKRHGFGNIITLDFNYGMLMTSLQQGRPMNNFKIRNIHDSVDIETSDLALSNEEFYNIPIADIIERFIVYHVFESAYPVVGIWPFFDSMDGALIVTHSENYMGETASWMAEYESTFKGTSTYFFSIPTNISEDHFKSLIDNNTEVAIQWYLPAHAAKQTSVPSGLLPISPLWRTLSFSEQIQGLKKELDTSYPLLSSQTAGHFWSDRWTRIFRILAENQIRTDASYAPPMGSSGFAFGTGFPFMPMDENGLIFNILEFPMAFRQISDAETSEKLVNMLKESQKELHEPISVAFNPDLFRKSPTVEGYTSWRTTYENASHANHWITSIRNFYRFSRARHNAELRSSRTESTQNGKTVQIIRLEMLAPEAGMAISVPAMYGEHPFMEARRGINRVQSNSMLSEVLKPRQIVIQGKTRMLIPISKGFNAVDVIYN